MPRALLGLLAGLAATGCMTLWEVLLFRKYGLPGCLDWDINQHFLSRLNRREPQANLRLGLVVHGIVGVAVGIGFSWLVPPRSTCALTLTGELVGVALWLLLLPLRKVFTGLGPRDGPLGIVPVLASLLGHLAFGLIMGAVVAFGSS